MPDRKQEADYRYGYQGEYSEKEELGGTHSFELRLWDARIGRWLSPDPYGQFYSPYLGMGNTPHMSVDPDGGCVLGLFCKKAYYYNSQTNEYQKFKVKDGAPSNDWFYIGDKNDVADWEKFIHPSGTISVYEPEGWAAWKEGNFLQNFVYSTANGAYTTGQMFMLRRPVDALNGTGYDSATMNLDGTLTTSGEGVLGLANTGSFFFGGGGVAAKGVTNADGFLIGSIGVRTPTNLNVGLYASENTLKYGTFKWSTIAPNSLAKNNQWFGRNMLQITPEFQPILGQWSQQTIPKGTYVKFGLVGPQKGVGFGTWLQVYAPKGVDFIK